MISREPTIERLATARSLLLEPFDLSDATLARALQTIATHRVDDADLYFQYTRSEGSVSYTHLRAHETDS